MLFQGGLDTVTATLDCVITRLAKDADLQAAARSNPEKMKQIVEELLRIESPVSLVLRYATEDMVMHDVEIAKGDMVLLMLGSANNDDREFDDPATLDVDRNNTRHLAFGGGVHRCLGSHLARQELMVALDEIFATLGPFCIPDGEDVTDVGANLYKQLIDRRIDWLPLLRSNKVNLHPLYFGIYGGAIYHHGAGFRESACRLDGELVQFTPRNRMLSKILPGYRKQTG